MRAPMSILLVASLVAAAFAGCLSAETKGEPTISRVHTLTLSPETTERAEAVADDDPMAALRELLKTDIVVRVKEEGDYTLEYTDASGSPRTQAIAGASPANPVTVSGADPIAPVVLKRGDETISVRAGISAEWWHLGDMPLGFNMTGSSKTKYAFTSRVQETFTLSDFDVPAQEITIDDLRFDLRIPAEGTASWELQPDVGEGSPLLLAADISIPANAGDLLTVDVTATQAGNPGTAGVVFGATEARAGASAKVWIRNGEPVAAQFLGGEAKLVPRSTAWATGFFEELAGGGPGSSGAAFSCAGKTKADGCQPSELESFEETIPGDEKEVFDPADFPRADDDEAREAVALMQRLFAQDIMPGDKAIVIARADTDELGASGPGAPSGDFLFEFTIEAVEVEELAIRAGTFDALKIIEQTSTRINVDDFAGPDGQPLVSAFNLDETIARATFWLDATTYQPLKMEASTPFNADAMLKDIMNAVEPSAWDQIGGKPLEDDQWTFTALAESTYEAIEFQAGAHFSGVVGLLLAHAVTGSMGAAPMAALGPTAYVWASGFGAQASQPAKTLALTSAGPAADGQKPYLVAAASPGLLWGDLYVTVDGMDSWLEAYGDEACMPPEEGYTVCGNNAARSYMDPVLAGDELTIRASPGQTMRIIDTAANSVILTLIVA